MSQFVDFGVAKTLKKGNTLYHNIIEFTHKDGAKEPATATVTGKVVPISGSESFHLPIRFNYGAEGTGFVSAFDRDTWRTVLEKEGNTTAAPPTKRVTRHRSL